MMGNLFETLSNDERIIVYSSQEDEVVYTWNQSNTLMCWHVQGSVFYENGILQPTGQDIKTYKAARDKAIAWHTDSL